MRSEEAVFNSNSKMIWFLIFIIHEISASNGNMILKDLGEKEYSLIKGKKLKSRN